MTMPFLCNWRPSIGLWMLVVALGLVAGCDDRDLALKFNADGSSLFFQQNGTWLEYSFAKQASRGWSAPEGAEEFLPVALSPSGNRLAMVRAAQGQFVFTALDGAGNKLAEVNRPQPAGSSYDGSYLPYLWSPAESQVVFNLRGTTWIFDLAAKKAFSVPGVKLAEFSALWTVLPGEQGFLATSNDGFLIVDWEGWVHAIPMTAAEKETLDNLAEKSVFLVGAAQVDEKESTVKVRWGVEWTINYQSKTVATNLVRPNIPALGIKEGAPTNPKPTGSRFDSQSFWAPIGNRGVGLLMRPEEEGFSLHLVQQKKDAQKVETLSDRTELNCSVRFAPDGKKIALQIQEKHGTKEKPAKVIRTLVIDDAGTVLLDLKAPVTE